MTLYFAYKNKTLITNEKVYDFEEKTYPISEMVEQEIKDHKTIDVVKRSAVMCSDILPVVAKLKEKENDVGHVAVEPHAHTSVPNHIIEVAV